MSIKTKLRALKIAIKKGDSRAIIQASESLDKLCGLEPARKVDITSSDGTMTPRCMYAEIIAQLVSNDTKPPTDD
jgi:hypothetical protein